VVGASLPGTPGVVIGHNEEIAWSVTAALTDVQDLYAERFAEGDAHLYEHADALREAEVREEEIRSAVAASRSYNRSEPRYTVP
jgi:penicillin amidase